LEALLTADFVSEARSAINAVIVEEGVLEYIARITAVSRKSPDLTLGASTLAATHVLLASKTAAALQRRDYVTPDDVKYLIPPIFRHRILLKPEAEIEGLDADAVIQRLLAQVEVPR
jgi:MoxR-like ATPase